MLIKWQRRSRHSPSPWLRCKIWVGYSMHYVQYIFSLYFTNFILHTYTTNIGSGGDWVTPKPRKRLQKSSIKIDDQAADVIVMSQDMTIDHDNDLFKPVRKQRAKNENNYKVCRTLQTKYYLYVYFIFLTTIYLFKSF